MSAMTDADTDEKIRGVKGTDEISPISTMNDYSTHDLVTPKEGEFAMHKSPPQIRRSHSDGILESTAEEVMERKYRYGAGCWV